MGIRIAAAMSGQVDGGLDDQGDKYLAYLHLGRLIDNKGDKVLKEDLKKNRRLTGQCARRINSTRSDI